MLDIGLHVTTNNRDLLVSEPGSLMENLEPLEDVCFSGFLVSSVLDKILQRHGPATHRLALCPEKNQGPRTLQAPLLTFHLEEIQKIESHCPLLEQLRISTPYPIVLDLDERNLSDVCSNLHHLHELVLDVDDGVYDHLFSEAARKIWDLIDKKKGLSSEISSHR